MIPYATITETADRRWTFRLLERLVASDLPDAELNDLIEALQTVSDPRSIGPLETLVCDAARPAAVRTAAGLILRNMPYTVPDIPVDKRRHWWQEGDAILRRHALLCMDALDCPDVVLSVALQSSSPLYADALGQMAFNFDLHEHQEIKLTGLRHTNPHVRQTAADILFWDEPVQAEGPLLRATHDPVPEVAAQACVTLQYYLSRRTVRCLHGLRNHPAEPVRQEAATSFAELRHEFLLALRPTDCPVSRHVRHWLEPIWGLLAFTEDELGPQPDARQWPAPEPRANLPLASLVEMLNDADASPKNLQHQLWRNDWQGYKPGERQQLRALLLEHPDPVVREEAPVAFEVWQDSSGLLTLVADPVFAVRKAAMYRLGQLPPTPAIAELAWEHLHRPDTLGVHAMETLGTFVRHASPKLARQRLGWLAGDHGRGEGLRTAAVYDLVELGAVEEISQLTGLLLEPPAVTWGLHIALLDANTDLRLPAPRIGHLRDVDNLHVQEAVARLNG